MHAGAALRKVQVSIRLPYRHSAALHYGNRCQSTIHGAEAPKLPAYKVIPDPSFSILFPLFGHLGAHQFLRHSSSLSTSSPMSGLPTRVDSPSGKRQRTSTIYQRKRAVAACQTCRQRKTKCDNVRPRCGFCQGSGAQCVYTGANGNDYSAFDPASLAILDRIDHVVSLLEARPLLAPGAEPSASTDQLSSIPANSTNQQVASVSADQTLAGDVTWFLDLPDLPSAVNSCEGILRWPIFEGVVTASVQSFVLEDSAENDRTRQAAEQTPAALCRGVQEDDIVPLSKKFLAFVHVKNPILDVADFNAKVRHAAEYGLGWDGSSCLVLVACALACLSAPFQPGANASGTPESTRSSRLAYTDRDTAALYYLAAKKRLGLVPPSLPYLQCLFLFGVYEMYVLNPMQAWFYFNRACVDFENISWAQSRKASLQDQKVLRRSQRLEQRLYWSCMKSECELRCEVPFPSSGIARCQYQDMFPSPPTELSSPTGGQYPPCDVLHEEIIHEEEKGWFYYLAEISFRRMMNRAMAVMGRDGEQGWLLNIRETMKQCEELNEQIRIWSSHIPPQISLDNDKLSNDELAHYVYNRALTCREWIHRPFLYYIIHQPAEDSNFAQALPLARKCLELCVEHLFRSAAHHRHHGTWYIARSSMSRALLLLGASRSAKIQLPESSRDAVDKARCTLELWCEEAPDLQWALEVLNNIYAQVWGEASS
ncbi:hypothetical protein MKZ38_000159 [Zalerion maritima]|uniref:Zn(2)-C6 fungal-type domain-containing protein n=1 Tax=Zalerion maritima TaxID=339359 RepID=A0AAD5WS76_9PEZI|nr:hypothetical protein MKZ38_000159 [Zalerion maritima]